MRKKKIGRDNIIKIGEEVDRIRNILCSIVKYAEGYKDPLDDLIYSQRELQTLKELKEANQKIKQLKENNDYFARIINRDLNKHNKRIGRLENKK